MMLWSYMRRVFCASPLIRRKCQRNQNGFACRRHRRASTRVRSMIGSEGKGSFDEQGRCRQSDGLQSPDATRCRLVIERRCDHVSDHLSCPPPRQERDLCAVLLAGERAARDKGGERCWHVSLRLRGIRRTGPQNRTERDRIQPARTALQPRRPSAGMAPGRPVRLVPFPVHGCRRRQASFGPRFGSFGVPIYLPGRPGWSTWWLEAAGAPWLPPPAGPRE